jgi:hypothetical protein
MALLAGQLALSHALERGYLGRTQEIEVFGPALVWLIILCGSVIWYVHRGVALRRWMTLDLVVIVCAGLGLWDAWLALQSFVEVA